MFTILINGISDNNLTILHKQEQKGIIEWDVMLDEHSAAPDWLSADL
jgi:hypothetical protein